MHETSLKPQRGYSGLDLDPHYMVESFSCDPKYSLTAYGTMNPEDTPPFHKEQGRCRG